MKLPRILKSLLLVCVLLAGANTVRSDELAITITLHENGEGNLQGVDANASFAGFLSVDPGPGGLSAALTFDLLNPPGLVAGDLLLLGDTLAISDVIRFNTAGVEGFAVFYSEITSGSGELADTGFPTLNYSNMLTIYEAPSGTTTYTPTAGQPGFVEGARGLVSYVISSSEARTIGVPESGSTILLLGLAICLLIFPVRARALARVRP